MPAVVAEVAVDGALFVLVKIKAGGSVVVAAVKVRDKHSFTSALAVVAAVINADLVSVEIEAG